jgi:hypothetical protein
VSEESLEPLLAYLRENAGRYSLEALRTQLLEAGHTVETADRAVSAFRYEQSQHAAPREKSAWPIAILVALLNLAIPSGIIAMLAALDGADETWALLLVIPALLYTGELIGGIVLLTTGSNRRMGKALLYGLALFVGICVVAFGGLVFYAVIEDL